MPGNREIGDTPFFPSHNISLTPDEPWDIIAVCQTERSHCQWRLHIEVDVGGQSQMTTVDDNGLPFETTGGDPFAFKTGLYWQWGPNAAFQELLPPP